MTEPTTIKRIYKVRKGNLRRIAELSPRMVARLRADGATVTAMSGGYPAPEATL